MQSLPTKNENKGMKGWFIDFNPVRIDRLFRRNLLSL